MNDKHTELNSVDWDTIDWDIQPERDLWPDINSKIRFSGKPEAIEELIDNAIEQPLVQEINVNQSSSIIINKGRSIWVPMSIAACLMLAFGAFIMSSLSLQKANQTYDLQANYIEYQKSQIALIEQQHQQVRAQFTALINGEVGQLNPNSVAEVTAALMTIDDASAELKKAILAQPMNANYSSMLARTYQKELKLLNKFKTANGLSI